MNWPIPIKQASERALKLAFARLLLKMPDEPFKAALEVFPHNNARALRVANEWPLDDEVRAFQVDLIEEEGEEAFLPTKVEACRDIWNTTKIAKNTLELGEYAKIMKLYCEARGFIEKPGTNINVQNNTQNNVMVLQDNGSDEEWEAKLLKQQEKLIDVSSD